MVPGSGCRVEVSVVASVLLMLTSVVDWYGEQRPASADPVAPVRSLVAALVQGRLGVDNQGICQGLHARDARR